VDDEATCKVWWLPLGSQDPVIFRCLAATDSTVVSSFNMVAAKNAFLFLQFRCDAHAGFDVKQVSSFYLGEIWLQH